MRSRTAPRKAAPATYSRSSVMLRGGSVPLIAQSTATQLRPPEPVDDVMSSAMSEHEPILVAPRKTVEGTSGSSGTSSVVADELTGSQHEQSLCSQKGVSLSLSAVMRSPGTQLFAVPEAVTPSDDYESEAFDDYETPSK